MSPRISRMVLAVSAGSLLAGSPLLAACSSDSGPSYSQWAATDGAAGRINLDDVQKAFQESSSATEFETKVNEIYEGDGIILIRASQDGQRLTLEGWEDLDGNSQIDDAADDQLFAIIKEDEQHQLRGYHANSYYHSHFGAGDFLFTYLLFSSLGGFGRPYYYQTPPDRGTTIRQERTAYRGSGRYGTQLESNRQYTSRQQTFAGSRYQAAGRNVSSGRQTYQQTQRESGAFRSSSSLTRSSSSSISRSSSSGAGSGSNISRSSGGFSGGGGRVHLRSRRQNGAARPAWLA